MKVAIFSESPADEAAIRVFINAVLNVTTDEIGLPSLQGRGWPGVKASHQAVMTHLHYRTDAEALVIVADLDDSVIHQTAHEQTPDRKCRLCFLRESVQETQSKLRARAGLAPLKIALGLALPAIEAWYLCGKEAHATEAACMQDKNKRTPEYKNKLKELVYGTSRPSLQLETQHAITEAQRLVQDIALLEQNFPLGFGTLLRDLRSW
ncbi:MAG: hypothetical protein JNM09_04315 [Blastocatellia bacterium]|nr:hypothetical protein [Blastocatellia bacterium]